MTKTNSSTVALFFSNINKSVLPSKLPSAGAILRAMPSPDEIDVDI